MATIAIDIGSSYSRVGYYYDEKFIQMQNDLGNESTPSYIALNDDKIYIGDEAKYQSRNQHIFDLKQLLKPTNRMYPFTIKRINDDTYIESKYRYIGNKFRIIVIITYL